MSNMTNTRNDVWKFIDSDPSIKLDIERNLINLRALARYCSEKGIEGTNDAIISAIRRYPKGNLQAKYTTASEVVGKSAISTKSHMVNIALRKGSATQQILPSLFSCIDYERGEALRLVQGEESIKLIIDEKNSEKILKLIPKSLVLKIHHNIAEINMHLPPEAVSTPGIMLVLTGELTRNNINMTEIMSCVPEMLIFVDEKDVMKAYQVLFDLCHHKK